jgi:hypothetical protein
MCSICLPNEADAVLIIYPNAELASAISLQRLKPISGWDAKIVQILGRVNLIQFAESDFRNRIPALIREILEKLLRLAVFEALNHVFNISCYALYVKRYIKHSLCSITAPSSAALP